jgi:hypothetical protein
MAERRRLTAALGELLEGSRYGATYTELSRSDVGTDRDAIHRLAGNVMREKALVTLCAEVGKEREEKVQRRWR